MSAILIGIENSTAASFPQATDTYWTTENRILWNEKHRKAEECELVYEVSWVSELNVWRSFLRSQRWLEATRITAHLALNASARRSRRYRDMGKRSY